MKRALVSILAAFPLVACATSTETVVRKADGGTSATEAAVPDVASFCKSYCDRILACDTTADNQTCQNQCNNANAAIFPRLRSEIVNLVVSCFGDKDCKTMLAGGAVGTCAQEAIASVAPSNAASAFCDSLVSAKKKCAGSSVSKAQCLTTAKLYTDDALVQAANCTARACTEIDSCVGAIFGTFGGGTTTGPEPTCSFSYVGSSCRSCVEGTCCAQATACEADSACQNLLALCLNSGTASSCSSAYSAASTTTKNLASAVFTCTNTCSSSCSPGS